MFKKSKLKREMQRRGFTWYGISRKAINQYRNNTKKNHELDSDLAHLKILRSVHSGKLLTVKNQRMTVLYGYLTIVINLSSRKIIKIHNDIEKEECGFINLDIKGKITEIYKKIYDGGEF